jgi:hypothetical protein
MARVELMFRRGSCALALALVAACSQARPSAPLLPDCDAGTKCGSLGSTFGGGTTLADSGSTSCGQIVFRDVLCNSCVETNCCDRNATCSADVQCTKIIACTAGCAANDMACILGCEDQWPNAVADYQNFVDCTQMACSTECAAADGGSSCGVLVFPPAACDACASANCCKENASCSNNADCFALVQCTSACSANDQVCVADCQSLHPNGAAAYQSLTQCLLSTCSTQCK